MQADTSVEEPLGDSSIVEDSNLLRREVHQLAPSRASPAVWRLVSAAGLILAGIVLAWTAVGPGGKFRTAMHKPMPQSMVDELIEFSASDCTSPVAAWAKCGGKGWEGSTCCVAGYRCQVAHDWYSQCVKGNANPTSRLPTTKTRRRRSQRRRRRSQRRRRRRRSKSSRRRKPKSSRRRSDPSPQAWKQGVSSCYGDYKDRITGIQVSSGYGDYITGEDFTYTTAICNTWAATATGSCYKVKCLSGKTPNMDCTGKSSYVRVIDTLGGSCGTSKESHIFDLSTDPYKRLATDAGKSLCSGEYYTEYKAVSCSTEAGLAKGNLRISLVPNQVDSWCPPFVISNVGGAGALFGVKVSMDGGKTWMDYKQQVHGNGGRWDCTTGKGTYLGKKLSFKIEVCDLAFLPSACKASGKVKEFTDVLPSNWCKGSPQTCDTASYEANDNFQ